MKILADFFPVLLFFVAYKVWDIYVATGVAIAASVLQVGFNWVKHRKVETMHLVTLGILLVFGGLTIVLQDRAFIMWKPSIVNWLFAVAFLASRLFGERTLIERMMGHAISVPRTIWSRLNTLWILFFTLAGLLNLYVASLFFADEAALRAATGITEIDFGQCTTLFQGRELELCLAAQSAEEGWVNFKLFGLMGLTVAFVIAQAFFLARHIRDDESNDEMTGTDTRGARD